MLTDALVLDGVRTPIGKVGGALSGVRPDDLAATAVKGAARAPSRTSIPPTIEEVYFGDANGAGEDNRNVARMAVLLAGLPVSIPGATVNRLCGSGLEAVSDASRAVAVGEADLIIAGGVESMTRAPWVLPKPSRAFPTTHEQVWNSALGWRMVNPKMPSQWTVALGEGAEILADEFSITREEQDLFALGSHERAAKAWASGAFDAESIAVPGVELARDECIREDTTLEKLAHVEAGVPGGRHRHAGQLVADERRRRRVAARVTGRRRAGRARADGPHREPSDERCRAAALRHRPGHRRAHGAATSRSQVGRHRVGGAERGVRGAEPGVLARAGPTSIPLG